MQSVCIGTVEMETRTSAACAENFEVGNLEVRFLRIWKHRTHRMLKYYKRIRECSDFLLKWFKATRRFLSIRRFRFYTSLSSENQTPHFSNSINFLLEKSLFQPGGCLKPLEAPLNKQRDLSKDQKATKMNRHQDEQPNWNYKTS